MMSPPLIIDVEASGLGRGSYPIEVGVVMPNGECYCSIIYPELDWKHWDAEAELLHGISREILLEYGASVRDVALALNRRLSGEIVYSDGWGNDSSWLGLLFDVAELPQRFRLESLRAILSEPQLALWHEVKDQIVAESDYQRHRASHDACILQQTFCRTLALAHG